MLACHNFDLSAAQDVGMQAAFVRRPHAWGPASPPDPTPNRDHDLVVRRVGAHQPRWCARALSNEGQERSQPRLDRCRIEIGQQALDETFFDAEGQGGLAMHAVAVLAGVQARDIGREELLVCRRQRRVPTRDGRVEGDQGTPSLGMEGQAVAPARLRAKTLARQFTACGSNRWPAPWRARNSSPRSCRRPRGTSPDAPPNGVSPAMRSRMSRPGSSWRPAPPAMARI